MNVRFRLALSCLVAAAIGEAVPSAIVALPARSRADYQTLADAGVRMFAATDNYLLVPDDAVTAWVTASAGLTAARLALDPSLPAYIVYCRDRSLLERVATKVPLIFTDSAAALIQADERTAAQIRLLGVQLIRLPQKPHLVYVTSDHGFPRVSFADTMVQRILARISPDSIRAQIRCLQDFRTRFSPTESCRAAEQYIVDYFTSLGMDSVVLDSYQYQSRTWRNPVGTIVGRGNPAKTVIICGHLDATSNDPYNCAPGAEDNASGTVMAMEAARVMIGERLDNTVKFIGWSGEEQGLVGSQHYAEQARQQGEDIIGVVNFDMISFPGGEFGVALFCNVASEPLAQFEDRMAEVYTTLDHVYVIGPYGSDQLSFQWYGYQATAAGEYGSSYPWYHTTGDTIGNLSMPLAAEVAKMGVAALATLATAPAPPDSFALRDLGSGGTLYASWRPNSDPDLLGYKLFWGTETGVYTDSLVLGRISSYRISGLTNGTRYYATVLARDSAGHEGGNAPERNAIPGLFPQPPAGITALPGRGMMRLSWLANGELDLAGYNIYRSTASGANYVRQNPAVHTDTSYRDSALQSDTMYYYVVTAVDTSGNESDSSAEVRGKPVTLDHGILLVDETRNGNGQPGNPSDAQVDDFYHAMLRWAGYTDWDVTIQGVPLAGDFGPYSTIVWHSDDYIQQKVADALPGIANYLSEGGRLWLTGWKPIFGMMDGLGSYPYTFRPGQFPYDWLHLSGAAQSLSLDFVGATGVSGYPNVSTDSAKMIPAVRGRLPYCDVPYPRDAEVILTFNSASGDTFQGKPVGVRWLTAPGKVVFFGFPLYYMKDPEARVIVLKVLDDLGEPYTVFEAATGHAPSAALVARPSLFRRSTLVDYSVATQGQVRVAVYDISGNLVVELANGQHETGHYSVCWSGLARSGRPVPAGIYFCRLSAGHERTTARLALLQ